MEDKTISTREPPLEMLMEPASTTETVRERLLALGKDEFVISVPVGPPEGGFNEYE